MRENITSAVAQVKQEVSANRLEWTFAHVRRLLLPYPKRAKVDVVLARIGDDTAVPEGEAPYDSEGTLALASRTQLRMTATSRSRPQ